MLKNKSKLLLIILMVITLALSPLSFADDEEEILENTQEEIETLEEIEEPEGNIESEGTQSTEQNTESNDNAEDIVEDEALAENTAEENTNHGDKYLIGDSITVDNIIDGNLYVLANEVTINSQIVGNAFICAQKVTILEQGYISNSLFVAANEITIAGISYDIYTTSQNLTITGYIFRDIHSVANDINIYGTVGRHASITAENISFEEKSSATSEEDGSTVEFISAQGRVMGDLTYSSSKELSVPEDSVEGTVKFEENKPIDLTPNYFLSLISFIVLTIAVWAILKWLAPKFLEKSSDLLTNKVLKTIGFGLLGLVALPIVAAILIVAVISANVGLLLLALYFTLICVSTVVFVIALNNILANKFKLEGTLKTFLLLLATSLVAKVLTLIPFVGAIFAIVYVVLGMGIIVRSLVSKKDKK